MHEGVDLHKFYKRVFHPRAFVQPQKNWKDIETENLLRKYTFAWFYTKKIKSKIKTSKKTTFLNISRALLITVILTGDIQHFTVFLEAENLPEAEKTSVGVDDAE